MSSLTAFDLLSLGEIEQDVLRNLTRTPNLTMGELVLRLGRDETQTSEIITRMITSGHIVECLQADRRVLRVRITRQKTSVRNMPAEISDLLAQPLDDFLLEATLSKELGEAGRTALMEKGISYKLMPDEVFTWQGQRFQSVALIRQGLISKVRLNGNNRHLNSGYAQRAEWIGISEILSQSPSRETYKAVAETELILWSAPVFMDFILNHPQFAMAVGHTLSTELQKCQSIHNRGESKLWVLDSVRSQVGVSSLTLELAQLAQTYDGKQNKVVIWDWKHDGTVICRQLGLPLPTATATMNGQLWQHMCGIDVFHADPSSDLPPSAHVDVILNQLRRHYDYVICDVGYAIHPIIDLLSTQASVLFTLTDEAKDKNEIQSHWERLGSAISPTQKRVSVLNKAVGETFDPAFQIVIPLDAQTAGLDAPKSAVSFHTACAEIFRRLSLEHTIAIFVPSTMDVEQSVDNGVQVQSALAFLGNVFGGATSSQADGVWKSEESGLVSEVVTIVRTFVSKKALDSHLDKVMEFATDLKLEMKQEAVAIDVDNQLILV